MGGEGRNWEEWRAAVISVYHVRGKSIFNKRERKRKKSTG